MLDATALEFDMTRPDERSGGRRKPSKEPPDDPYCTFKDDRERRNALVSRDVRIAVCRLAGVAGVVVVAVFTPAGSLAGSVARMLASL
jgi:hypothetical protein